MIIATYYLSPSDTEKTNNPKTEQHGMLFHLQKVTCTPSNPLPHLYSLLLRFKDLVANNIQLTTADTVVYKRGGGGWGHKGQHCGPMTCMISSPITSGESTALWHSRTIAQLKIVICFGSTSVYCDE